ncbi:aminopeptidase [Cohnella cellulosilytica]|uniref:Aminopeptidase n=1 Tax=Cohnella cellulosilytica TaxID=986710 RepID=A0ABW2FJE1_9BACL
MNVVKHIIEHCGDLKSDEWVCVLYDNSTFGVASVFLQYLEGIHANFSSYELIRTDTHGIEPPDEVAEAMKSSDLILCLTQYSLAHTQARLEATNGKSRFLSMPEYSVSLLNDPAVATDFRSRLQAVEAMTQALTNGKELYIETAAGTRMKMDISNRGGNCCPGFVNQLYRLGSPPDIEANIAPNEASTEGMLVIDGSITHELIGKLTDTVELRISKGKIDSIYSANEEICQALDKIFTRVKSDKAYYLGEVGIGLNKDAVLCGNMLIDEGSYGSLHFGFGSNYTIGGSNKVSFHLDFVLTKANMYIDGTMVIKEGEMQL